MWVEKKTRQINIYILFYKFCFDFNICFFTFFLFSFNFAQQVTGTRSKHAEKTGDTWAKHWGYMGKTPGIHGQNTGDTWAKHWGYMGKTLGIHGMPVCNQSWDNPGKSPVRPWFNMGTSMEPGFSRSFANIGPGQG